MSFTKFEEFLVIISSNILTVTHLSPLLRDSNDMGVIPQVPVTVYVSILFLSVLQIGSFLWIHLQVQGTFFCHLHSALEPPKCLVSFRHSIFQF